MKLEDLLGSDADTLEKLSDADLHKFFEPMLNITRPDRDTAIYRETDDSPTPKRMNKKDKFMSQLSSEQQLKLTKMLGESDIDLEDLI